MLASAWHAVPPRLPLDPPPACPCLDPLPQEARIQRVLQRAQAPRFQRRGKPAMARSVLQRAERAQLGGGEAGEEAELAAFLALIDETFHC